MFHLHEYNKMIILVVSTICSLNPSSKGIIAKKNKEIADKEATIIERDSALVEKEALIQVIAFSLAGVLCSSVPMFASRLVLNLKKLCTSASYGLLTMLVEMFH